MLPVSLFFVVDIKRKNVVRRVFFVVGRRLVPSKWPTLLSPSDFGVKS